MSTVNLDINTQRSRLFTFNGAFIKIGNTILNPHLISEMSIHPEFIEIYCINQTIITLRNEDRERFLSWVSAYIVTP